MDIQNFTRMMQQKEAQQIILTPNQPLRLLKDDQWREASTFTPSEQAINRLLQENVPPDKRDALTAVSGTFDFPYETPTGDFKIEVKNSYGVRTVTITNLSAPPPAVSAPASATPSTPPSSFTANPSSGLSARSGSQIAREMSKGNVNIMPPSLPNMGTAPAPAPSAEPSPTGTPPALPVAEIWHHAAEGKQTGPVTQLGMEQCIRSNIVRPDTLVWREGMPDWSMAKLTELESLFKSQPPPIEGDPAINYGIYGTNSSGRGWNAPVPNELFGKFNGGAFFLTPFWCFAHGVWYLGAAYFVFIFFVNLFAGTAVGALIGLLVSMCAGMAGNEVAWRNRRFESIEQFNTVQTTWTWVGIALALVWSVIIISSGATTPPSTDY